MTPDADTLQTDPDALRALSTAMPWLPLAVQLAFCWAHWRRKFYEIVQAGNAPVATEALARIVAIYAIESAARRKRHAATFDSSGLSDLSKSSDWLEVHLAAVSRKSTIAEAIRYGLGRWDCLVRFLDDGRIEIDSNVVERTIRPIAFNRKNALCAGSDGGGEHWATLASLIETCKLNASIPRPIPPTSSRASPTIIRSIGSTNSCPGSGPMRTIWK